MKPHTPLNLPARRSCESIEDNADLNESLLEKPPYHLISERRESDESPKKRLLSGLFATLNFSVAVFNATFILYLLWSCSSNYEGTRNILLKETNYYYKIDINLKTKRVNGSLTQIDAAWHRIANVLTTAATAEEVRRLGKNPAKAAKYPADFGLGSDAYIVELDVFHQIHCLESLRKLANFDYYFGAKFPDGKPSYMQRQHTAHCIHILLQSLMCSASTDGITHTWVDVQKHPIPDFSIDRQCRDFDAILKYQEENVVDFERYSALRRPTDVEPERALPEFVALFGQEGYYLNDAEHP